MQISEISADTLGGLRGLGLTLGQDADVAERAAAADRPLVEQTTAPAPAPGDGSTNFDLSPPSLTPSIKQAAAAADLMGRKLTLDLDVKVATAIQQPAAAVKLAKKVKALTGKVKVTPKAAKAIVKSIAKASPAAAKEAAKALAPAVAPAAPVAPASAVFAPAASTQVATESSTSRIGRWFIWGGIGVVALGAALLFLRRRRATQVVAPVQTQGLAGMKSKRKSKKKSSKKKK